MRLLEQLALCCTRHWCIGKSSIHTFIGVSNVSTPTTKMMSKFNVLLASKVLDL